ncbi:DUF3325 domain-containing protein [Variovorax sp. LT1R16]|uniref:DUF3325 domain-containing protein n=1 Tax=Variovorax sp. LT1R16 TaxID=3443728 RepID=UPI003F4466CD
MSSAFASFTAPALCFAGMAALSLAIDRHYAQLTGRDEPSRRHRIGLRIAGWLLLALGLWRCIAGSGWSVGLVLWCGLLTAGAMLVAWTLLYIPRWTAGAAIASGAVVMLSLITG